MAGLSTLAAPGRGSSPSSAAPTCPGRWIARRARALARLRIPGNVGTLLRAADALGPAFVLLSRGLRRSDGAEGAAGLGRRGLPRAARRASTTARAPRVALVPAGRRRRFPSSSCRSGSSSSSARSGRGCPTTCSPPRAAATIPQAAGRSRSTSRSRARSRSTSGGGEGAMNVEEWIDAYGRAWVEPRRGCRRGALHRGRRLPLEPVPRAAHRLRRRSATTGRGRPRRRRSSTSASASRSSRATRSSSSGGRSMRGRGRWITLPGCLLLRFAADGRCEELREYWHVEDGRHEPPPGWGR